jgi:hypothetical protein
MLCTITMYSTSARKPSWPNLALGLPACSTLAFNLPKGTTKSVPYTRSLRAAAHIVMDSTVRLSDVNLTTCRLPRYLAVPSHWCGGSHAAKVVLLDASRRHLWLEPGRQHFCASHHPEG